MDSAAEIGNNDAASVVDMVVTKTSRLNLEWLL